jgi:multidrug resistance efflux pump
MGSALGAWWLTTQRTRRRPSTRDHGTVIFDNTPVAPDVEGII